MPAATYVPPTAAHVGVIGAGGTSLKPTQLGLQGSLEQGTPLGLAVLRLIGMIEPPPLGSARVEMLEVPSALPWHGLHAPLWHVCVPLKQSTKPSCCATTAWQAMVSPSFEQGVPYPNMLDSPPPLLAGGRSAPQP